MFVVNANSLFEFSHPKSNLYSYMWFSLTESPKIRGGLTNLRLLKTTQSAFRDFFQDGYRTLPDANDRIFSTVVTAEWEFSTANGVDFDSVWEAIKECILDKFAGPPDTGAFSPSVQNTLYLAEKMALDKIPQVSRFLLQFLYPVFLNKRAIFRRLKVEI